MTQITKGFCLILLLFLNTILANGKDKDVSRKVDYFFYEALRMKEVGQVDAAYDLFTHALQIDSTAAEVMYELSPFYARQGDTEKALSYAKKAVESSPDNFTYQMALASMYRNLRMYAEAAEAFKELAKAYPNKIDLNYYLAESLIHKGDIKEAIAAFNTLEESVGMSEGLSMEKFKLYKSIGESKKAFAEMELLADKYIQAARFQFLVGDLYLQEANAAKALQFYERARDAEPNNPQYIVSMANYYQATGNKVAAEKQVKEILDNAAIAADTKVKLGMMYGKSLTDQKRIEEAKAIFKRITEIQPTNKDAWLQRLGFTLTDEKIDEMMNLCKQGITLFPDSPEFYFYLGIGFYQKEDYQNAISTYEAGIKIIPVGNGSLLSTFYGQLGDIYQQLKQMDKAYAAYDKALEHDDKNVAVLNNYSYFLSLEKRDLKKAERMSAKCIKLEPDNATYLDTYAWIFFVQENYTLAKMYIRSALTKDKTNSSELVNHYGDILFMTGDKDGALEQWKKAKEMGHPSPILDKKIKEEKYIEE